MTQPAAKSTAVQAARPGASASARQRQQAQSRSNAPARRSLRGYAFDPSMATQLDTAMVSGVTYHIPWEPLATDPGAPPGRPEAWPQGPGPCGEYVQVIDVDPASGCFYAPVDLNQPSILAQAGLAASEGNPQFHQQMVYAVAMTTIYRFERALGRKAFWADRQTEVGGSRQWQYVPQLRIYPHALRMANAYYSRQHGALLFGYFPATEDRSSGQLPGGMVFTCLSHDVVAHETTHALLDGFHEYFLEPTNPDVLAFHEAFADIVALFQHFTLPEQLRHQIAKTRGDLGAENLLAQLATQFGHARGSHGALRDAIGRYDPASKAWVRHEPDPTELERTPEVHARGAILVAAVFDAFLSIYRLRTRDLLRLASGGTGVLQQGELHPDLVARLADEAAKVASQVLNMCVRALDYCPPVDLTFGEYLRALITADIDLVPNDSHRYRVAFIEAFRRRGIYPSDIHTLSEDSLCWSSPGASPDKAPGSMERLFEEFVTAIGLREKINDLRYLKTRGEVWTKTQGIRAELHERIKNYLPKAQLFESLTGLALSPISPPPGVRLNRAGSPSFQLQSLREARRQTDDGRVLNQVFITLLQEQTVEMDGQQHQIRCGSTLVIDLDGPVVRYVVKKGLNDVERIKRVAAFRQQMASAAALAATYFRDSDEPFAALHRTGA